MKELEQFEEYIVRLIYNIAWHHQEFVFTDSKITW